MDLELEHSRRGAEKLGADLRVSLRPRELLEHAGQVQEPASGAGETVQAVLSRVVRGIGGERAGHRLERSVQVARGVLVQLRNLMQELDLTLRIFGARD